MLVTIRSTVFQRVNSLLHAVGGLSVADGTRTVNPGHERTSDVVFFRRVCGILEEGEHPKAVHCRHIIFFVGRGLFVVRRSCPVGGAVVVNQTGDDADAGVTKANLSESSSITGSEITM